MSEVKVFVNLEKNIAVVMVVYKMPIFNNNQFLIEYDRTGYSCIERREDGFYECNYMDYKTKLSERKLTEEEALEEIIKVLEDRFREENE